MSGIDIRQATRLFLHCKAECVVALNVVHTVSHRLNYLSSSLVLQPYTLKINASTPAVVSRRDASFERVVGTSFCHVNASLVR